MGPAGAVYSSVLDMSNWLQAWIYGGKFNGLQVVPAVHFKEATSGQSINGFGMPDSLHPDVIGSVYGFGWSLASYKGHYRVEHGGAIDGFHASVCFFPSDSIGIIVLSNQDARHIPPIVRNMLADRMLGVERSNWNKDWIDMAKKAKATQNATQMNPTRHRAAASHNLSAYEGLYTHPGYGTYDVFKTGDSLMLRTSRQKLWLRHWHYDVFVPYEVEENNKIDTSQSSSIRLRFNTDVNGEISSMNAYGFEAPSIELVFKKMPRPTPLDKSALNQYIGEYEMPGMVVKVYIKNENTLVMEVPGQPPYEQVAAGNHRFVFKTLEGYSLLFEMAEGEKAKAVSFIQPNGTFKATRKK
jgi:hypothetical protein